MFEIDLPPPTADASPTARRFTPYAALALGALIVGALSLVWVRQTASADRLDPAVEEWQAGLNAAPVGLAGLIGGAPFLAMMEQAGASEAQIERIVELAQGARSDVERLTAAREGRPTEAADAARARIDRAMAEMAAALTPAQRARLSGETIAAPAKADGAGRRFEISRWRGL